MGGNGVQLGALGGRIREIGMRASTVGTWAGAEVIVPNAATSERVTNWTLSDTLRRMTLEVGAYSAAARPVLEILRSVAFPRRDVHVLDGEAAPIGRS